ncbi:hypothetical protein I546_5721 [Mycobacterium kansasii 732]|nr:hypothetical protein I546_5721 [Mycobacterium kansasii 732]
MQTLPARRLWTGFSVRLIRHARVPNWRHCAMADQSGG